MKILFNLASSISIALIGISIAVETRATEIVRQPLQADGQAKPNVIFGMDDSGSMDFETLVNGTADGMLWWDASRSPPSAWDAAGKPVFKTISNGQPMAYLSPNGCASGGYGVSAVRNYCDSVGVYSVPPTPQFASIRSASYNPLYYDPTLTYAPWLPATINQAQQTFGDAAPSAARSHPLYTSPLMNLQAVQSARSPGFTFKMLAGMVIPAGAEYTNGSTWTTVGASGFTLAAGQSFTANIPYWPASYWSKEPCALTATTCVKAPDGSTLKLYEIRASTLSYPSGRTYAAELQNFANWFVYYRKRKLMLAGSMGQVLNSVSGMRLGLTAFNNNAAVTMYDTDATLTNTTSPDVTANGKVIAGLFYQNAALGGTPTRATLAFIGGQYRTNKPIIQYSCQRNAVVIVTDGFADGTPVTVPSYTATTWGATPPYTKTYAGSLADLGLALYTVNPRSTDFTQGMVPAATASVDPAADKNNNLHVNTYAITLNSSGYQWPGITNPYTTSFTWADPAVGHDPTAIDDLWHATINGRGSMLLATNPKDTAASVQATLTQILRLSGSQSGVTYSTVNLRSGNAFAYVGSYKVLGWSGDIESFNVDPATGVLAAVSSWSANTVLGKQDWTTRKLVTFDGTAGASLNSSSTGLTAALVGYLRGDRSVATASYRATTGLLGAVVNADVTASLSDGVVYGATNEGFLHAFDMGTGAELWAYAPSFNVADMKLSSDPAWLFKTILDSTPVLGRAGTKKILVGGRGSAGSGYYALDVTTPKSNLDEAAVAKRVLWEFPNASTSAADKAALGVAVGRPLIVTTTTWGDVVVLTSGYNSTQDGKGRIFVLNALTGRQLATLVTTNPAAVGSTDTGLAQISGWLEADGTVNYVYGGDEQGNLWRFSLLDRSVINLASLVDASNKTLPITTAPELSTVANRRMVFVGTGRLLGRSDLDDNRSYSFFSIWDKATVLTNVRTQLASRAVTVNTDGSRAVTGADVNWTTQFGWFVDLPAGEKANTDPTTAFGAVAFTTNRASATSCLSSSALYVASTGTGLMLAPTAFALTPYYGMTYAATLSSRATLARSSTGKLAVTSRQVDGTVNTRQLSLQSALPAKKTAWRELLR